MDDFFKRLESEPRLNFISGIVVIFLAIAVCYYGIYQASKANEIRDSFTKTEAVVIESKLGSRNQDETDYYNVVLEFTAQEKIYEYRYRSSYARAIGGKDILYYNPDNPAKVYREDDFTSGSIFYFLATVVLGFIGVAFIYTGFWLKKRKRTKNNNFQSQ
jgi:hypothetical protein